jgi:hypothetical protein
MRLLVAVLSAAVLIVAGLVAVPGQAGYAAPADPDGTPNSLQDQLTTASRAYTDAKARLDNAQRKQADLARQLAATDQQIAALDVSVSLVAVKSFRSGRVGDLATILNSVSPDDFVQRALVLHQLAAYDSRQLRELRDLKATAARQQTALSQEINAAKLQQNELAKQKSQIQQTLDKAGGGPITAIDIPSATAVPAPRNADGGFSDESCSQKDPTTSGCLTPRTLHAYQEARKAGFTHFTACFRQASFGEHPKGRACDFAAAPNGFGGIATGADREYGNRLAGFFIANSDRLGVLYVIWYHQIWTPGVGWHYYTGDGTPSGDHMNHVHLSER